MLRAAAITPPSPEVTLTTTWWPVVRPGPLVTYLDDAEHARLLSLMEEVNVPAGSFILHKDSPARSVLLVEDGEVEVIEESLGQTVTLAVIKAGGVVGEVGFVDGRPRTNNVRARTDARLRRLTREKLLAMVAGEPTVFGKIMMSLAELMAQRFRITLAEMEPVRAFAQSLDEPIDASGDDAPASFDEIDEPLPDAAEVVEVLRQVADASRRGRAQV